MIVQEILKEMKRKPAKPMSKATLYTHLRVLRIKPLGKVRQIPAQYPDDTPHRIKLALGLEGKQRRAA